MSTISVSPDLRRRSSAPPVLTYAMAAAARACVLRRFDIVRQRRSPVRRWTGSPDLRSAVRRRVLLIHRRRVFCQFNHPAVRIAEKDLPGSAFRNHAALILNLVLIQPRGRGVDVIDRERD